MQHTTPSATCLERKKQPVKRIELAEVSAISPELNPTFVSALTTKPET